MAVPVLKQSCCGCCSVETGSLVLAILHLIASASWIAKTCVWFVSINHRYKDEKEIKTEVYLNAGSLIVASIHLLFSILLIISVKQRKSKLAIPWLVEDLLMLLIAVGLCVYIIVISGIYYLFIVLILCAGIRLYFWWIVFSFHHELKLEEKNKPPAGNNMNINSTIV